MTHYITSRNKSKHYEAACLSLNRLRYGSDKVSNIVIANDPDYWNCIDLFQDFFQSLEHYSLNQSKYLSE